MSRKLPDIRAIVQQLLRDEFDPDVTGDFKDEELDIHIGNCLYEISDASPYKAIEALPVTANSKVLDISGVENLIRIDRIEYKPGSLPRNYHNFEYLDNETVEMKVDTAPDTSSTSGTLTGTVTFTAGSATVAGAVTDFDGELEAGYFIKPSSGTRWYRVYSIESDTSLTLDEPVKSDDAVEDTVNLTQYRDYVALVYCDKSHILTEEKTTLNPKEEYVLIMGVCGKAAVSKGRSLINSINYGGGSVPREMENWGLTQIQLYKQALKGFPPRTKTSYATS